MPTRRRILQTLTGATVSMSAWSMMGDGEYDELAEARPGANTPWEKANLRDPPTREIPTVDITTNTDFTREEVHRLSRRAYEVTNERRADEGIPPLKWSDNLAAISRLHAWDMIDEDYVGHGDPDPDWIEGPVPNSIGRLRYFGYQPDLFKNTENLTQGDFKPGTRTPETIGRLLINSYLYQSDSHRRAILDPDFDYIGIGTAVTIWPSGTLVPHLVQMFTGPGKYPVPRS